MRSLACLVTVTMAGLLTTACGQDPGDVEAGDCFEEGTPVEFGWGTEVSCDRPHTVEVFAVRDVSDTLGQYPRGALEERGSQARQEYLALLDDLCEPAWSEYTGFDRLAANAAPGAQALPAIYGDMALEATPASEWDEGNRLVVCYQVFGRPHRENEAAISVDVPVLETMREDQTAVPVDVRDCARSPVGDEGEQRVSCLLPHDREYLGHLNGAEFVGSAPGLDQGLLDRFDSATSPDQDWAVLDRVCRQVFSPLLHPDNAEAAEVTVLAQVFTGERRWGWGEDGEYHIACFARNNYEISHSLVTPPTG